MVSQLKNAGLNPSYRWVEILSLFLFSLFTLLLTWKIAAALFQYSAWTILAIALPAWLLGWLTADFASGLVHFLCDNFGSPATPVFGQALIRPFREHHDWPHDMVQHDLVETNGNNCLVCLPFLLPAYFLLPLEGAGWTLLFAATGLLFFFYGIGLTNQFHKWAHDREAPRLARFLQRCHLSLPPLQHGFHHAPPFKNYYCITCGWLNPVLERLRFFQRLENRLRKSPKTQRPATPEERRAR